MIADTITLADSAAANTNFVAYYRQGYEAKRKSTGGYVSTTRHSTFKQGQTVVERHNQVFSLTLNSSLGEPITVSGSVVLNTPIDSNVTALIRDNIAAFTKNFLANATYLPQFHNNES